MKCRVCNRTDVEVEFNKYDRGKCKDCTSEYMKAWRAAHPGYDLNIKRKNREKVNAQQRERYARDPAVREKRRQYYQENRERILKNLKKRTAEKKSGKE